VFRKKNNDVKPPVTCIWLSFNITAIEKWLESKRTIEPVERWSRDDEVHKHLITLLPQDPFLFYHDDKRTFSPGIGGFEYLDNKKIESLEWKWKRNYFFVLVTNETIPVFFAPLSEIFYLLQNRYPSSLSERNIDIEIDGGFCKQVHQYPIFGSGVGFRNELVDINFSCENANDLVQY
jgi:hypothetical protein